MELKLFYSYSHKDSKVRKEIEKTLQPLEKEKLLIQWHDGKIPPGKGISQEIENPLDSSNIYLFLMSRDFIVSEVCNKEWNDAKEISKNRHIYRIPIIVKPCSWKDFLADDDVKSLPNDGVPISTFKSQDIAFEHIYEGIKQVIENYKTIFTPKNDFLKEFKQTDFISEEYISFEDIFVFPKLEKVDYLDDSTLHSDIENEDVLLKNKFIIIHGEDNSGKTTLCKNIFLSRIKSKLPVLFIDLESIDKKKKPSHTLFEEHYKKQFEGEYSSWESQEEKTIIFDNLSNSKHAIGHIELAMETFDRVIISVLSNDYIAYFSEDKRISQFSEIKINELTYVEQETLITKRLAIMPNENQSYENIDQIEDKINSIIHSNLIPRYPFYILSILQTLESYMPSDLQISTYGHCYKVLIIAFLVKSGINKEDGSINTCFNFLEQLAFKIYSSDSFSFEEFQSKYQKEFIIEKNLINRLKGNHFALIDDSGKIKQEYVYYYFLGSYFSKNKNSKNKEIEKITEQSFIKKNSLILLFIIHHTTDVGLIDNIILYSMCSLDHINPATLNEKETKHIEDVIKGLLPDSGSIKATRKKQRQKKDEVQSNSKEQDDFKDSDQPINDIYKILKNNELFAQILRNHHGNLTRTQIQDIVEVAIDSGLRLVTIFLDKQGIEKLVQYIHQHKPDAELRTIRKFCYTICFQFTMLHIERIVSTIKIKEIQNLVAEITKKKSTPANDLIGYFTRLDSLDEFKEDDKNHFEKLYRKYKDNKFMQKVLSRRTQAYMDTHDVKHIIKQSIYSTIKKPYKYKIPPKRQLTT